MTLVSIPRASEIRAGLVQQPAGDIVHTCHIFVRTGDIQT